MGVLDRQALQEVVEYKNINNNNNGTASSNDKPWVLFLEELSGETNHAFFDPINRSFSSIEIPQLNFPVQCLSSGHGWLLLLSRKTSSLFFFNPSTRSRIDLPYRKRFFDAATFTAPPTSSNCILYAVEKPYNNQTCIRFDVLRVGDSNWSTSFSSESKGFATVKQALYYEGHLYCIDSIGRFGEFDSSKEGIITWNVLRRMKCSILRDSYLVESHGEIFAVVRRPYGVFGGLYKLKFDENCEQVDLEKVRELGNATFFVGSYGSCSSSISIEGNESKDDLFAGYRSELKCVVYKFDVGSDCKQEIVFEATKFGLHYTPVWVEPLN